MKVKKKLKNEKSSKSEIYLNARLLQGLDLHRKGQLNQAEVIYKEIIHINPINFDALQLLGALYLQNNQYEEALENFNNALLHNKLNANLYYNLGMASHRLNHLDHALEKYEKAIELKPDFYDAYTNRGNVLKDLGLIDEAIDSYEIAISINPQDVKPYSNLGAVLKIKGSYTEALKSLEEAILIKPDYAEAHCNRADVLKELMRFDDAVDSYNQAIKIRPSYIDALCNKGVCLTEMKNYVDAIDCYEKAIEIDNRFEKAWCNKGVVFNLLNKYEDALNLFDKAISLNQRYAEAWSNKGLALLGLKKYEESILSSKKAIDLKKDLAEPHLHLAQAFLSQLYFDEGWKEYEWRWKIKYTEKYKLDYREPIWNGEKKNNTLFVWAEQGVGDQILYSSVFSELENYPQNTIVTLDKKLIPIYQRTYQNITFIERHRNLESYVFDEQIAIGSLMQLFRKNIGDFKKTKFPYLIDDQEKTFNLKNKISCHNKIICGISWRSENPLLGDYKSIKLKDLSKIICDDRLHILNLQYTSGNTGNNSEIEYFKFINEINGLDAYNDIDALISAIQVCDLVITCSNTTAHLAGALNKPTLLLLPAAAGRFWYWSEVNKKSIWYPSVRIFHQKKPGDWNDTVDEIHEYLSSY